jgi:hypothetical protein
MLSIIVEMQGRIGVALSRMTRAATVPAVSFNLIYIL